MMLATLIATAVLLASPRQASAEVTFSGPTEFPGAGGPFMQTVVTGDLNGDSHLDLVAVDRDSSLLCVFFGNGTGNFSSRIDLPVLISPHDVSIADFNHDAHLDLAVIHGGFDGGTPFVSIFLGDGAGGFGPRTDFMAERGMTSIKTDDLNGDSHLDLVIGTENGSKLVVLFGDGVGGFSGKTILAAGTHPMSVAVGDINRDGNLDIVTANLVSDDIAVLFGDGSGSFPMRQTIISPSEAPIRVALGDLNNDQNPDILVTTTTQLAVFVSKGDGTFFPPTITNITGAGEKPFTVADFNADGNLDVFVTHPGLQQLLLFVGAGDGSLAQEMAVTIDSRGPRDPIAGDFNEDGLLDVAFATQFPGKVAVFLQQTLLLVTIDIQPGSDMNSIRPGGKGKISVAILSTDNFDATTVDPTTVLFGSTGTETAPVHSAMEDVDRDGDLDIILKFNTQATGIQCGNTSASLNGKTFSGQPIRGSDSLRTAGCK